MFKAPDPPVDPYAEQQKAAAERADMLSTQKQLSSDTMRFARLYGSSGLAKGF